MRPGNCLTFAESILLFREAVLVLLSGLRSTKQTPIPRGQQKQRSNLTMDSSVYEATRQVGMQIHEEIDAPPGEIYLRAGIYDMNSGYCGTVGAALNGSSEKRSKK